MVIGYFILSSAGAGEVAVGPTDDWFDVLNGAGLRPGDTVILKEGVYTDSRKLTLRHRGTEASPIVIRAEQGKQVTFKRPDAKQNTLNLEGAEFLELREIEITGGSAAIRISNPEGKWVQNITLNELHIYEIGGVAVTCNHPGNHYEKMHFHGNHIHHTSGHGEAFYLGGNNDSEGKTVTVFRNSIVETNYIHHLDGPDISQGDGIEVKDGSYGNMIRNNVIHDTKYPGVTLYGTDGNERNVVEGNVIWNTGDNGIQVAADARVLRNIIMDAGGDGIRSKQQSARVGNLDILENTILKENGVGIRVDVEANVSGPIAIRGNIITAPEAFRIAKNAQVSIEENEVKPASSNVDRLRVKEQALRRLGRETELK